jgi:N-acetylglutamate synthase-like GNAT family acetyltransferase
MAVLNNSIALTHCTSGDFERVKQLISDMCLDNNELHEHQFSIAKHKKEVYGFGRLRTYSHCQELCSLGVIQEFRLKRIGSSLTTLLIERRQKPLYVVTIIPAFFSKFGFKQTLHFPLEIKCKLEFCETSLTVPEPYVVMVLEN